MRYPTKLRLRLRSLFRRAQVDHELDAELRFHLDHQIAENLAAGMSSADARDAALRTIGGIAQFKEECRDARRIHFIEDLTRDLAYAFRQMRRTPVLAVAAIASLALGIGANTAIFSLIDAVLLRTLPVERPGQLVLLGAASRNGTRGNFSSLDYQWIRDRNEVFTGVLASSRFTADMTLDGRTRRVNTAVVSGNYFSVLGVQPAHGRLLSNIDDTPNAHAVAVISHAFWTRHFGLAPQIIGQTLQAGGALIEVVGVAPPEFFGESVGSAPDLWVPSALQPTLTQGPSWLKTRNVGWLDLMARLKPGVRIEAARSHLAALLPAVQADLRIDPRNDYLSAITIEPGAGGFSFLRRRYSEPLRVLMGAVAIVLLLACANVSNLLIARAAVRRREFAVRLAIGAGRGRLIRQLFVESLLLGAVAGAFGLLLAPWTTKLLVGLIGGSPVEASLNLRVLGFSAIVTLAASLIFGMAPSLHGARINPGPALKLGRQSGAGIRRWNAARLLVSAQVALSLSLLVGAGLFARTLINLQHSDPGFDRDNVLQVQLDPQAAGYKGLRSAALAAGLTERIAQIPGVRSASVSAHGFSRGASRVCCIAVQGYTPNPDEDKVVRTLRVSPRYFETMGIALMSGRDFTPADSPKAPPVAVINETMARHYFGDANPVGKRFGWNPRTDEFEIIGVVRDARYDGLRENTPRLVYQSHLQGGTGGMNPNFLQIRLELGHARPELLREVRRGIEAVDSHLPILEIATLESLIERTLGAERIVAQLALAFGALALILTATGLYGVMAFAVAQRTAEIGVRMALGAGRTDAVWLIIRETLQLIAAGVAVGLPTTIAASKLISNQLFGLGPHDPGALGSAVLMLLVVTLTAAYVPARRASRLDPVNALRCE